MKKGIFPTFPSLEKVALSKQSNAIKKESRAAAVALEERQPKPLCDALLKGHKLCFEIDRKRYWLKG